MGLLKSLLRAVAQSPAEEPTGTPLVLEGDESRTVYTYDPRPLKGLRKGSVFYADVITKPVKLTSPTGGVWDTGEGGVALSYNGGVFGGTNALGKTFHELADAGYATRVKAKRLGMYDQYVPEVVMLIPDPDEVFLWRDACKWLGREAPFDARHTEECERAAASEHEHHRLESATGMQLPRDVEGVVINRDDLPGVPTGAVSAVALLVPPPLRLKGEAQDLGRRQRVAGRRGNGAKLPLRNPLPPCRRAAPGRHVPGSGRHRMRPARHRVQEGVPRCLGRQPSTPASRAPSSARRPSTTS